MKFSRLPQPIHCHWPRQDCYPMLLHLSRSGINFLYIFSLLSGRYLLLFPSVRWESLTTLLLSSHLLLSTYQSFLNASLYCVFFLKLIPFSLLARLVSAMNALLKQILFLSQPISDGFNKSILGSQKILTTVNFSEDFDSASHPAFCHKMYFGRPPSLFRAMDLLFPFLKARLHNFSKSQQSPLSSPSKYFSRICSVPSSSMIFLLPSAVFSLLTTRPFDSLPSLSLMLWRLHKEL